MELLKRRLAASTSGLATLLAALSFVGCTPDLEDTTSLIRGPRLVAVRAEPPEAAPGQPVTFSSLLVDVSGTLTSGPVAWSFCSARKPLTELGPANRACFDADSDALAPIGIGLEAQGRLPSTGCRLFGPNPPEPRSGEPAGRPADPDTTGGYYQPVRAALLREGGDDEVLFEARIACPLAGATQAQAAEFRERYVRNVNPNVASLQLVDGDQVFDVPVSGTAPPPQVAPGARIDLRVAWPAEDAETYVRFDTIARSITDAREAIRVAWLATGGAFEEVRTGRAADDLSNESRNSWTAPTDPGDVFLWIVVRDDRGGTGWASYTLQVAAP